MIYNQPVFSPQLETQLGDTVRIYLRNNLLQAMYLHPLDSTFS